VLSNSLKICPPSRACALWRRLEKEAENMLIGVDQILELISGLPLGVAFSAILTKCHLQSSWVNCLYDWSFCGFHTFTALITTTSFIGSQIFENLL
jgi:hypothetical protein